MKYYINEETGSRMAMQKGKVPSGFKKVSEEVFVEFEKKQEAERLNAIEQKNIIRDKKFRGFKFDGVMCSATKDDQAGLTSVIVQLDSGIIKSTNFEFSNGSTLELTTENIVAFTRKWAHFRQRFFTKEG